jgi:hypothetical protein
LPLRPSDGKTGKVIRGEFLLDDGDVAFEVKPLATIIGSDSPSFMGKKLARSVKKLEGAEGKQRMMVPFEKEGPKWRAVGISQNVATRRVLHRTLRYQQTAPELIGYNPIILGPKRWRFEDYGSENVAG